MLSTMRLTKFLLKNTTTTTFSLLTYFNLRLSGMLKARDRSRYQHVLRLIFDGFGFGFEASHLVNIFAKRNSRIEYSLNSSSSYCVSTALRLNFITISFLSVDSMSYNFIFIYYVYKTSRQRRDDMTVTIHVQ